MNEEKKEYMCILAYRGHNNNDKIHRLNMAII